MNVSNRIKKFQDIAESVKTKRYFYSGALVTINVAISSGCYFISISLAKNTTLQKHILFVLIDHRQICCFQWKAIARFSIETIKFKQNIYFFELIFFTNFLAIFFLNLREFAIQFT